MENDDAPLIVLAAGGTGGHIFPAQALAEELHQRGIRPVLITDKRFQRYTGAFSEYEIRTIRSGNMGGGLIRKLRGAVDIGLGVMQARRHLKALKPMAVIGFGGYPSFPTMLAATKLRLPTLIHEQNAVLGRANKIIASRVNVIATAFDEVQGISDEDKAKVAMTGNPVRSSVRALKAIPYPQLAQDGLLHLLILGGSQGATIFGTVLPGAMEKLPPSLRARIRIDQQCRPEDIDDVRTAYQKLGINADLATFFTDIPTRLAATHLVITRAGASTVAELMMAGRPAILVPLPTAMDDHQTANARAVEEAGLGWLMPQDAFTPEALSAQIERLLQHPNRLSEAAAKAGAGNSINAAATLADVVLRVGKQG